MKELVRKSFAEFLGTFVLVFFACGTAVVTKADVVSTALSFGLVIVAMAYAIGGISGCHINPAVSLGALIAKRMDVKTFGAYVVAQVLGAVAGAAALYGILKGVGFDFSWYAGDIWATNGALVAVAADGSTNVAAGIFASLGLEIILTFVFVFVILNVTAKKEYANVAGIVIGLTLTLVHLIGINLTGTSVNPARSIGPAVMAAAFGGGTAGLADLWVFIVAPLIGGALAAVVFGAFNRKNSEEIA